MATRNLWVLLAFGMTEVGLIWQLIGQTAWADRLLTIALILLGIDQTRMAIVDLDNIAQLQSQTQDPRLNRFRFATHTTIGLELLGFFLAWKNLGWGALLILFSQVWFNTLAGVQLLPNNPEPNQELIQSCGLRDRWIVLLADCIGIALILLWLGQIAQIGVAIGLLSMIYLYGLIKYGGVVWRKLGKVKSTNVN